MLEDNDVNNALHIPYVTGKILAKVIEYCKKHVVIDGSSSKEELKNWDAEFTKIMDDSTLLELITAAKFLNIESLFDLTYKRAADLLQDKTDDEICTFLNIKKRLHTRGTWKIKFAKKIIGLLNDSKPILISF